MNRKKGKKGTDPFFSEFDKIKIRKKVMKKILITGANSYIGTSFEKYINENLDRERWCNMLDTKLFSEIKEFFDESIG